MLPFVFTPLSLAPASAGVLFHFIFYDVDCKILKEKGTILKRTLVNHVLRKVIERDNHIA